MNCGEIIKKVIEIKENSVRAQEYEFAGYIRDIENSFTKSKHARIHLEPTLENLKIELHKVLTKFDGYPFCIQSIRDLKLKLLLDEL